MPHVAACVAALFLAGAVLLRRVHRRSGAPAERRQRDWRKYAVYVVVVNGLWATAYAGPWLVAATLALVAAAGLAELRAVRAPWTVALVVGLGLGHLLLGGRGLLVFTVLVTAATDSFAELGGRLYGTRPLCPRLSPHKTVEGLVTGLLGATGVALLLAFLLPEAGGAQVLLLGICVALAAMAGDLLFSAVKRAAGVKDFSAVLPGHGGVLDRFDSLVAAAPVGYWLAVLLS